MRWMTRIVYASSSFDPATTSSAVATAEITRAATSAETEPVDGHRALGDRVREEQERGVEDEHHEEGRRDGVRELYRPYERREDRVQDRDEERDEKSAAQNPPTSNPGRIKAATNTLTALTSSATKSRVGRRCGLTSPRRGVAPCSCGVTRRLYRPRLSDRPPNYHHWMSTIEHLVDELDRSYAEAQERMADPAVYNDRVQVAAAGRRLKELESPHRLATEWRRARADLDDARGDPELAGMAAELEDEVVRLEEELKLALVEKDPADEKDVIVEIRPGVGGDEAALWAGDVYRMLTRYAERRRFKTETLSTNENEAGGFKEVVFAVKGDGAFSVFKYEGGTHRVQRVPETESQGRIHTSTATVAVMPEVEEVEVQIEDKDLKIDVMRSTGPGGQSVNTTDSAVRITHLPTGLVVAMQDEKSQLQNKQKAMRVLRARLYELERGRQQAELAEARRSQIGGGERAEKIRTYNFPENRLTDHRIKLTVHRLDQILEGELGEFTEALQAEDRRQALAVAGV